jgi:hypothetical protein
VAGAAVGTTVFLHPCFQHMAVPLLQLVADPPLVAAKHLSVAIVEFLDDSKRPPPGEQVASHQESLQPLSHLAVPGFAQRVQGLTEHQVGVTDQLVKAIEMPARTLDVLQRLGELSHRRDGLLADAGHAAIGVGRTI